MSTRLARRRIDLRLPQRLANDHLTQDRRIALRQRATSHPPARLTTPASVGQYTSSVPSAAIAAAAHADRSPESDVLGDTWSAES